MKVTLWGAGALICLVAIAIEGAVIAHRIPDANSATVTGLSIEFPGAIVLKEGKLQVGGNGKVTGILFEGDAPLNPKP